MLVQRYFFAGLALLIATPAQAINYFELEVYPYRTAAKGELELENYTTFTGRGSDDALPPDNNEGLFRSTFEGVYGVTDKTEVAAYLDFARPRGDGWDHAGSRIRARHRFAEKGELPVDLGVYAEFEFPRNEGNTVELELRGIIEKDFGKWTFDLNPIFEKAVRGPNTAGGWELQYAAAIIYRLNERFHPRLDFFGDFGPIRDFEPAREQKHLISPAIDIRLAQGIYLGLGFAFGLTEATEQRLIRTQLEFEFY